MFDLTFDTTEERKKKLYAHKKGSHFLSITKMHTVLVQRKISQMNKIYNNINICAVWGWKSNCRSVFLIAPVLFDTISCGQYIAFNMWYRKRTEVLLLLTTLVYSLFFVWTLVSAHKVFTVFLGSTQKQIKLKTNNFTAVRIKVRKKWNIL